VFVTVPVTGGTPTVIYEPPGGATGGAGIGTLTWSPDGARIAFLEMPAGSNDDNIVVYELASGARTEFHVEADYGLGVGDLDWARTGDALAFDAGGAVYTLDMAVGVPVLVAPVGSSPSWSPDDSELVYTAIEKNKSRIKRINLSTGVITTLSPVGTYTDWRRF
jgi:Tol biopolymer transport system component